MNLLSALKSLAQSTEKEVEVKPVAVQNEHVAGPAAGAPSRRGEIRRASANEYSGIDIERANALSARLARAGSDSEAIAMLRGDSVQVVHQQK